MIWCKLGEGTETLGPGRAIALLMPELLAMTLLWMSVDTGVFILYPLKDQRPLSAGRLFLTGMLAEAKCSDSAPLLLPLLLLQSFSPSTATRALLWDMQCKEKSRAQVKTNWTEKLTTEIKEGRDKRSAETMGREGGRVQDKIQPGFPLNSFVHPVPGCALGKSKPDRTNPACLTPKEASCRPVGLSGQAGLGPCPYFSRQRGKRKTHLQGRK